MKIGRYEVIGEIGQGAMGTVYRARDPLIEREVAIKSVSIRHLQEEGTDAEARFLREARSAGRLSHPNIVTIYDVGETESLAYIAMEYLQGPTLRELMDRHPLPLGLALDTAYQMAEALAFAHEHGVVHRDIKPGNVVVTGQRGRVKLTDFGIAHVLNSNQTQTGQMLGSPRYMSPEQAMGREIDGRSDIFSLGAVLYEMLTGEYAFDGDSLPTIIYRVVNDAPAQLGASGRLPPALSDLLARMLHKQPKQRPDAREVALSLTALIDSIAPAQSSIPPRLRISRRLAFLAFATPLAALLLIGLGLIVIEHFLPAPAPVAMPETVPPALQATPPTSTGIPSAGQRPPDSVAQSAPATSGQAPSSQRRQPARPVIVADDYLRKLDGTRTELRIQRTELLLRYTEQHPDVLQIDRQLEQLAQERKRHVRLLQKQQNN